MADEPHPLLPLAALIANGTNPDWDAAAAATPDQRELIAQLRVLHDLARAHRDADAEIPNAAPATVAPPSQPIDTWAQLPLLEELGAGSFGVVYRAWDPHLAREVAVKVVRAGSVAALDTSRIAREGRLLARLRHPNIVTVHGAAVDGGQVGIWMELIRGITLEQAVTTQGPFSARDAARVGLDVCRALSAVHHAGLLHRDVKAQNVMREDGGRIVLMDFGTGREIDAMPPHGKAEMVGTPLYLAPEIFRGEPASVRTDVYSTGVLLYHLVTASFPHPVKTVDELRERIATLPPVRLRDARADLPEIFVRAVSEAMADDPEARCESAAALEQDLLEALDDMHAGRRPLAIASSRLSGARLGRIPSIAVLPFVDLSRHKDLDYFAEGISEEITNALTRLPSLRVAARTSAFQFRGRTEDIRRIGDVLNVETVLEGSVRATDGRLRVIAQLSNTTTGYQLWSERFEQPLENVFAVQDEIAEAVVRTLRVQLGAGDEVRSIPSNNLDAYTSYLKGRHLWNRRTEPDLLKSLSFFRTALRHDPEYVLAHAGLADAYATLGIYGALPPAEVAPKGRTAAQSALSLSDDMPEAFTALACLSAVYDWNWTEAERLFRQAIALQPDYPTAHSWLALNVLVPLQRFTEAEAELELALERDPLSRAVTTGIGMTAYYSERYADAVEDFTRTLELDDEFPLAHAFLAQTYAELERYDEAVASAEKAVQLSGANPEIHAAAAYVHGRAGRLDTARALLHRLTMLAESRYVSASLLAQAGVTVCDVNTTLDWLEKACEQRAFDLAWIAVRPAFKPLRTEPRFRSLCERMGLLARS
jgi:serine/threonine protein kinase/tetratricopeptide (TPR) repeat protein